VKLGTWLLMPDIAQTSVKKSSNNGSDAGASCICVLGDWAETKEVREREIWEFVVTSKEELRI
jgi:hypothetical protein